MRDLSELLMIEEGPPVSDDHIASMQQLMGAEFPNDYIAFLRRWNGGAPELSVVKLCDGEEWSVSTFYGITMNASDENDLLWAYHIYSKVVPAGVIPIAYDAGGNQTCLDLRPGAVDQVLAWDHDRGGVLRPVSSTFAEFIDSLYRPDYA